MGTVTMTEVFPATTESEIRTFERKYRFRLPDDYRQFLLRTNGGAPEPFAFTVKRPDGRTMTSGVEWLFGINTGNEHTDLAMQYEYWSLAPQTRLLPAKVLPLGVNGAGHRVALDLRRGKGNRIVLVDFPNRPKFEGSMPELLPLADSFDAFFHSLRALDEVRLEQTRKQPSRNRKTTVRKRRGQ